ARRGRRPPAGRTGCVRHRCRPSVERSRRHPVRAAQRTAAGGRCGHRGDGRTRRPPRPQARLSPQQLSAIAEAVPPPDGPPAPFTGVLPLFPTSKSPGLSSLISVADDEVLLNTNLPPEHDVRAAAFGLGQRLVLLGGLLAGLRPGTAATTADVLRPQCSV